MSSEQDLKTASSVHDVGSSLPPFGSRFLINENDVWSHNAWDHVPPPEDQAEKITASLSKQRQGRIPDEEKHKYNTKPSRHWDNFYKANASNFFKDRKWLHNEFPELVAATKDDAGPVCVAEIGCGAGNSVFPLISANQNPSLVLHAYDYSPHAVKLVQHNPLYLSPSVGLLRASVWDATSGHGLPSDLEPESVDIVVLVFVMSALHPDEWGRAISNIHKMLKPGGLVLMRDYGRHDLTQLRFKAGRLLEENLYIRGDKTRVYFFELDELALLFTGSKATPAQKMGRDATQVIEDKEDASTEDISKSVMPDHSDSLSGSSTPTDVSHRNTPLPDSTETTSDSVNSVHPSLLSPLANCPPHPLFAIEQLGVDRRLLVNRKRQLKMYRVWMQGKFKKLS